MITDELNNTADVWNKRYQETKHALSRPRSFLIDNQSYLPDKGLALDIGMGLGYNAKLLARPWAICYRRGFLFNCLKKSESQLSRFATPVS